MDTLTIASINFIYDELRERITKEDLNEIVVGSPDWEKDISYNESGNVIQIINKNNLTYIRRDFEYDEDDNVIQIAYYISQDRDYDYHFYGMELYEYDGENLISTTWYTDEYHQFAKKPTIQYPTDGSVSANIVPVITGLAPVPSFLNTKRLYRRFEIIKDGGTFANPLISAEINSNSFLLDEALEPDTVYHVRIADMYESGITQWSNVIDFQTTSTYVETPDIFVEGAPDNVGRHPELTGSAYSLFELDTADYHEMTDWRIIKSGDNTIVWESLEDDVNLESITPPESILDEATEYQFQVRYKSNIYGYSAWASQFNMTGNIYVETPTLTIEGSPSNVPKTPLVTTSGFNVINGTDTHVSTDWRITRTSDFHVMLESIEDTSNLESIMIPYGLLSAMTEYKFQVRHRGNTYGASQWEEQIITTENQFFGNLFAGSDNDEIRKIYTTDMSYVDVYNQHGNNIKSLDWGLDNNLYSASVDDQVHKINPVNLAQIDFYDHVNDANVVVYGGDGYLYFGGSNNEVHKLDPSDMSLISSYSDHTASVTALVWGGDGKLYSGSEDDQIHKIDPSTMINISSYTGHSDDITSLMWGGDGYLYSTAKDDEVHQIDPVTMTNVSSYTGHLFTVNSVIWGDGHIYTAANDYEIHKIDPNGMSFVSSYTGHSDNVLDLVWGGNYFYSASADTEIHQIDPADMSFVNSYSQFLDPVNTLSWDKSVWENYGWTVDIDGIITNYGSDPGPSGRTY